MLKANIFAGGDLDRAAMQRSDADWLQQQLESEAAVFLPVFQLRNYLSQQEPLEPVLFRRDEIDAHLQRAAEVVFLGLHRGVPYFAFALAPQQAAPPSLPREGHFDDIRACGGLLAAPDAARLAYTRAMLYWHQRHRFCGVCGGATRSREGGHLRECTREACAAVHFPRTDPAIIVLVTHGNRCLLGRQKSWRPGIYSTLAGFVEPGESLEEAVTREVYEETGVRVGTGTYHSSQPWPFPASLMIGFTAEAMTTAVTLEGSELEDARWFTRQDLLQRHDTGGVHLPRALSIARRLVVEWLGEDAPTTASR